MLVVGSGHSAFNALLELAELARSILLTRLLWPSAALTSSSCLEAGNGTLCLHAAKLGQRIQALVEAGQVHLVTGVHIQKLYRTGAGILIAGEEERLGPVDEIIATTGFRPELSPAA